MFINKTPEGLNNICGKNISKLRLKEGISQRKLADRMQLIGLDLDKNAIQRIECGKRFVTDIEIIAFAKVFNVAIDDLCLDKLKEFSPLFEEDIYEAISLETCVEERKVIGGPSSSSVKLQLEVLYKSIKDFRDLLEELK